MELDCSAWINCSRNLQDNNCTFADTAAEALQYSAWSYFITDHNVIDQSYNEAAGALRHLCINIYPRTRYTADTLGCLTCLVCLSVCPVRARNKLPHSLRVPYQSGSSLSSPLSSGSNPEPAVNRSHVSWNVFRSRLKTYLFSKSFPP